MIPLAACSLAVIYLAIHCYRETRPANFGSESLAREVADRVGQGRIEDARSYLESNDTILGSALRDAIPKLDPDDPQGSIERYQASVAESLELAENATGQWIHYLSVVANTAPMIGLLGTVSGMIGGFQTMSSGGMGRPELFAGDISEALITTAAGLCIGIPAMIAHSFFNNRLNTLVIETSRRAGLASDSLLARPAPIEARR